MKKIFNLNFVLLFFIMVFDICYIVTNSIWLKAVASLLFVINGLINLIFCYKNRKEDTKVAIFIFIGLFFGMLGDIILNFQFIIGAALFGIAHIFYVISYAFLISFNKKDILPICVLSIVSVLIITLVPIFEYDGIILELVCVTYGIVISFMVGKAISNFLQDRQTKNLIILIASILFFFSDFMLLFNVFSSVSGIVFTCLCLLTYYPAQFMLSFSILVFKSQKN